MNGCPILIGVKSQQRESITLQRSGGPCPGDCVYARISRGFSSVCIVGIVDHDGGRHQCCMEGIGVVAEVVALSAGEGLTISKGVQEGSVAATVFRSIRDADV